MRINSVKLTTVLKMTMKNVLNASQTMFWKMDYVPLEIRNALSIILKLENVWNANKAITSSITSVNMKTVIVKPSVKKDIVRIVKAFISSILSNNANWEISTVRNITVDTVSNANLITIILVPFVIKMEKDVQFRTTLMNVINVKKDLIS